MSKVFYLYLLVDPRAPTEVRYVGQTINTKSRLRKHISDAKRSTSVRYSYHWIQKLLREGVKPKMLVFASFATKKEMNEGEIYWIAAFKECGYYLTNSTEGGEGTIGFSPSEETRKLLGKISRERAAAMTPEQRRDKAIRANASLTPEERSDRQRRANASLTAEQRSDRQYKAAASQTAVQRRNKAIRANASQTREQRQARQRKAAASQTIEQRKERAKKINASMTSEQRSERSRKSNEAQTPENRRNRQLKAAASQSPEKRVENSKKAWLSRTPEQRAASAAKMVATRSENRAKRLAEQLADRPPT